jgi:hypothetical protein
MKKTCWILLVTIIAMLTFFTATSSVFAVTACPEPFAFT